jgi:hypothetical protein
MSISTGTGEGKGNMKTAEELANILKLAQIEAYKAEAGDDNGTCNLDDVVFQPGRHAPRLKTAMELAGWRERSSFKWIGATTYSSGFSFSGQANQRARMVQAAYDYLKDALTDDPIEVWHYQQMD